MNDRKLREFWIVNDRVLLDHEPQNGLGIKFDNVIHVREVDPNEQSALQIASEALEFYADKKHWLLDEFCGHEVCGVHKSVKHWTDVGYEYDIDSQPDIGDTAHAALEKIKKLTKE